MSVLLLIFGPSLLGFVLLVSTCLLTRNLRWLGIASGAAMLLHCASVGLVRVLLAWGPGSGGGASTAFGLLLDLLIMGWAVIAAIALAKYALVKHAQAHR